MPNWCSNRVEVYAEAEEIKRFREYVSDGDLLFSFQKIKPIPEDLVHTRSPSGEPNIELTDKYGVDNWYDWCIENWGVKWDVHDVELEEGEDYITYRFDTPWGPPNEIYNLIREEFPDINLSWFYDEPGMEMAGYLGTSQAW